MAVWANSMLKSKKLFSNSEQSYNATLVQYVDNKIFAIGRSEARLHIVDLELNVLQVVDYQFTKNISVIKSSNLYVAIGDIAGNVTVFEKVGNLVLVSYF